jgi:chromosome segregation ATPase
MSDKAGLDLALDMVIRLTNERDELRAALQDQVNLNNEWNAANDELRAEVTSCREESDVFAREYNAAIKRESELRAEVERLDKIRQLQKERIVRAEDEIERLQAQVVLQQRLIEELRAEVSGCKRILSVLAACSENDDVPFGEHLCVEQVRVEVARHKAL